MRVYFLKKDAPVLSMDIWPIPLRLTKRNLMYVVPAVVIPSIWLFWAAAAWGNIFIPLWVFILFFIIGMFLSNARMQWNVPLDRYFINKFDFWKNSGRQHEEIKVRKIDNELFQTKIEWEIKKISNQLEVSLK